MKKREKYYFDAKIKVARALFFVNALLWLGFSIYLFTDMRRLSNNTSAVLAGLFVLMIAGTLLGSGIMIVKRIKWAFYFGIVALIANIFLNFISTFGVFAYISTLVDIVLFMILVSSARFYFSQA